MKWTVLPLIAAALIVYGLLFAVHAVREHEDHAGVGPKPDSDPLRIVTQPIPAEETAAEIVSETALVQVEGPGAVDVQESAGEIETSSSEPRVWEGGAWAAGCRAFEDGDYATARLALEQAVCDDETKAGRHYLLGLDYLKLDEAELAVSELERSVSLDPTRVRSYVHLGRAYLEIEDSVTAREVIDASLEIQLDFADAWQVLGRVELAEGNREEAEAAFLKASELNQGHAWAFNNLGYVRILDSRFSDAVEALTQAVALNDELACFHNNLGVALEQGGDLVGAVSAYQVAAEIGHATALASAERVETVVLARGLLETELEEEPRLAAALADTSSVGAW